MDWTTLARMFADEDAFVAAKCREAERNRAHQAAGGTTYGHEGDLMREKARLGGEAHRKRRAAIARAARGQKA